MVQPLLSHDMDTPRRLTIAKGTTTPKLRRRPYQRSGRERSSCERQAGPTSAYISQFTPHLSVFHAFSALPLRLSLPLPCFQLSGSIAQNYFFHGMVRFTSMAFASSPHMVLRNCGALSWLSSHTTFSRLQVHPPLPSLCPIVRCPLRATLRRRRLLRATARGKHEFSSHPCIKHSPR
jgi:hypothetical protein